MSGVEDKAKRALLSYDFGDRFLEGPSSIVGEPSVDGSAPRLDRIFRMQQVTEFREPAISVVVYAMKWPRSGGTIIRIGTFMFMRARSAALRGTWSEDVSSTRFVRLSRYRSTAVASGMVALRDKLRGVVAGDTRASAAPTRYLVGYDGFDGPAAKLEWSAGTFAAADRAFRSLWDYVTRAADRGPAASGWRESYLAPPDCCLRATLRRGRSRPPRST